MSIGWISWLFTVVVFGAIGCALARRRSRPAGPLTYVALLAAAVAGYFVGVDTRLADIVGFTVLLNWAIVSCCLVGCVGVLIRSRQLRKLKDD